MPKTNIDYLRELLTTNEQQEFLDEIETDIYKMKSAINDLREDYQEAEKERDKARDDAEYWEEQYDEKDEFDGTEIPCVVGTIRYECEGSMDLQILMEALVDAIKDHGYREVLDNLRNTYSV